jgi:hypothetical protein
VAPEVFADDLPFADPAQLLIVPDHYVFRMLASQGIEPARLGVPRLDDGPVETDSRTIWRTFCENWKLFRGTPSRYWLEHELVEVFGVDQVPSAETADAIYDQIAACVADAGFRPRALLDRFNIEVISTTDSATSDLGHHAKLAGHGNSVTGNRENAFGAAYRGTSLFGQKAHDRLLRPDSSRRSLLPPLAARTYPELPNGADEEAIKQARADGSSSDFYGGPATGRGGKSRPTWSTRSGQRLVAHTGSTHVT